MKNESRQFAQKKLLVQQYQENFGIFLTPGEESKLFRQLDDIGLELVLKKKLASKKQYIAAQCI